MPFFSLMVRCITSFFFICVYTSRIHALSYEQVVLFCVSEKLPGLWVLPWLPFVLHCHSKESNRLHGKNETKHVFDFVNSQQICALFRYL